MEQLHLCSYRKHGVGVFLPKSLVEQEIIYIVSRRDRKMEPHV